MDIKNFKYGGTGKGRADGVIYSEKWENHKNSTHTKIKFYIIWIFFSTMNIKNFTNWVGGAGLRWVELIFWHISILYHQCNNKNTYQQVLLFTLYILLIVHICIDWYVFPFSLKSDTFGCKKCIFSPSFWNRWLKHISFCKEFNCQQCRELQKIIFHLFP